MIALLLTTTNKINGRYYRYSHLCNHGPDCDFLGDHPDLLSDIQEYGVENFENRSSYVAESPGELWDLEPIFINAECVNDPLSYNTSVGNKQN